jgi:hypothetical protein
MSTTHGIAWTEIRPGKLTAAGGRFDLFEGWLGRWVAVDADYGLVFRGTRDGAEKWCARQLTLRAAGEVGRCGR